MAPAIKKLDLKKDLKALYGVSPGEPTVVDVPAMNFLMIDGTGDPNVSPDYSAAIEALYGVSYTLKFTIKRSAHAVDYAVMPLEGLWWADDPAVFATGDKSRWKWTAMIMQPPLVSASDVVSAIEDVRRKHPSPALDRLRFEAFREGKAAQLLHVGPYASEGPNIKRLHDFIAAQGHTLGGKHHEIYLGDPRRSAPEKLKTIIRQPFAG